MRKLALSLARFGLLVVAVLCAQLAVVLAPAEATGLGKIQSVVLAVLRDKGITTAADAYSAPQPLDADLTEIAALANSQGDVLITGAGPTWTTLGTGTSGHVLTTAGAAANPSWTEPRHRLLSSQRGTSTSITYQVPAATLGADDDALAVVVSGIDDDAGEVITLTYGGQSIYSTAISASPYHTSGWIVRTGATTCTFYGRLSSASTTNTFEVALTSVTHANANDLVASFSAADAGDEVHLLRVAKERAP